MSEITKSLSEVLRKIAETLPFDCEVFYFPKKDIGCNVSVTEINESKNTGCYFTVKVNITCECRVSLTLENAEFKAVELASAVVSECENASFGCTGGVPENLRALPDGVDKNFVNWFVNWDQEFYVERIDLT